MRQPSAEYVWRDVYLEQIWDLDASGFPVDGPTPNSGVWVSGEEISSIEFYPYETNMTAGAERRGDQEVGNEQGTTRRS